MLQTTNETKSKSQESSFDILFSGTAIFSFNSEPAKDIFVPKVENLKKTETQAYPAVLLQPH